MDLCSLIFLKESLTLAAYEGARLGVVAGGTNQDVIDRVTDFLDQRNISYGDDPVTFSDPDFNSAGTLEHVETVVSVPISENLLIPSNLWYTGEITATVTFRKEYQNNN